MRKAFTLVELMIVTVILGVVASAVVACLVGGIRAWDNVRNFNGIELKTLMGLEIMEKDLVNSFDFDGINFDGGPTEMSFAALVIDMSDGVEPDLPTVGTVKYEFDASAGTLKRKAWVYPATESEEDAFEELLVSGVTDARFEYYYFPQDESGTEGGGWQSGKDTGTNYIGGVRVSLEFPVDDSFTEIKRTIMFPVSHMVFE